MVKKRQSKEAVQASQLEGFKYLKLVAELFQTLHDAGTLRDKAGNRELYFDQYAMLMLLYFFNPILTSLRGTQKTTSLEKVQKMCGVRPTSLGSLSEASRVFDPKLLEPIIAELAQQVSQGSTSLPKEQAMVLQGLTAVDGSLLPALPKMAWALWQDAQHRAAKMHVAFAVVPGAPVGVTLTAGNASERDEWRKLIEPGGFYVADRGYVDYSLFKELDADGVRFLVRVQQNAAYEVTEERPLTEEDVAAGVVQDVLIRRLGTEKHNALLEHPWRIVTVQGSEPDHVWILATNNLVLSAEMIAIAYRYRWQIELFFRWLKCVLGCRHLLSHSQEGVTLQVYFAIIASLLIGLWTGSKPTKRLYEMICLYFAGWATAEELSNHIEKYKQPHPP